MKTKQSPMQRYTKNDFDKQFPNDDACLEWLKNNRWPDGIYCEACQRITKHHRITKRSAYACDFCGKHVYPMAGTILEHSATPMRLWFHAMFLMASTRCGISAKQLQRELGVTYKTAWRMFKQIRSMLNEEIMSLLEQVEVDETYIGGRRHGKRGRGAEGKTPVLGMVQRNGNVIAVIVPNVKSQTLVPIVKKKVLPSSIIYTDELPAYNALPKLGYRHKRVHHESKVYVMGDAHTNTIEGFWSLVKRGISGVNHAVSAKYLQGYINAYAFRWNHRNDETPMFSQILSRLASLKT
jgi:transposase